MDFLVEWLTVLTELEFAKRGIPEIKMTVGEAVEQLRKWACEEQRRHDEV